MSTTVVIGAGVIGLTAAYELQRRGERVIVVDMAEPGGGCSSGNAGWIVPSSSAPLPSPRLTRTSLKWMVSRDSPLYIRVRPSLGLARWLWAFWRHCNEHHYLRGLEAIAQLNQSTLESFDRLQEDSVEFEMHTAGLLYVFLNKHNMEHVMRDFSIMSRFGYRPPTLVTADELREVEPGLSADVVAGILVDEDRHVRPETLTVGLVKRLSEARVDIRSHTPVVGMRRKGQTVLAIRTQTGEIHTDRVLIAAGAWSVLVAKVFGVKLPVEAGKGYSITVIEPQLHVSRPLNLAEAGLGISPFRGALRLAGTMELSGLNLILDSRRIASIRRSATRYIPAWDSGTTEAVWVGMRPLTPDGLPLIGRLPSTDNVYITTGHAMLGVTLAPSTAICIADLMCRGESSIDLAPFDPGRFARFRSSVNQ